MHLDSPEALGVLNTLFETVAPSSLRPVDMLLKSMFTIPVTMVRDFNCIDCPEVSAAVGLWLLLLLLSS